MHCQSFYVYWQFHFNSVRSKGFDRWTIQLDHVWKALTELQNKPDLKKQWSQMFAMTHHLSHVAFDIKHYFDFKLRSTSAKKNESTRGIWNLKPIKLQTFAVITKSKVQFASMCSLQDFIRFSLYQHDITGSSHLMFRIKQTFRKTQNKLQHLFVAKMLPFYCKWDRRWHLSLWGFRFCLLVC